MFEVGFSELLLIMALALIVLGPEKLPKVASQVGRWMGRARSMARQFRETLDEEVQLDPTIRRPGGANASRASGGSSAGAAASSPADNAASTSTAAAAGLDTGTTSSDNDPLMDSGAYVPYSDAGYSAASGDDADTRHNDYAGAAYEPPDTPLDVSPDAHPNSTHTAAADDVHGQRGT